MYKLDYVKKQSMAASILVRNKIKINKSFAKQILK